MPPSMRCSHNHDGQRNREATVGTLRVCVSTDAWKLSYCKPFVTHPKLLLFSSYSHQKFQRNLHEMVSSFQLDV